MPDRNGKIFYTSITSLSHISKVSGLELEAVFQDILTTSKDYYAIQNFSTGIDKLDSSLRRLDKLGLKTTYSYLLNVFDHNHHGLLEDSDLIRICEELENYIFRRIITDQPANSLTRFFPTLDKNIYELENNYEKYLDKLIYFLSTRKSKLAYPADEEFSTAISARDFYAKNNNLIIYALERFENRDSVEVMDVYSGVENKTYQVEHIMPQTLSGQWERDLGSDYSRVHSLWLYKLANLTLTGYNQQYSNSPFKTKRDCQHGFKESGFRINRSIAELDQWTEKELNNRSQLIKSDSLKLWPYPETSYIPPDSEGTEKVSLASNESFTNCKLEAYAINGKKTKCSRWVDMMVDIVSYLHSVDKSVLFRMVYSQEDSISDKLIISEETKNSSEIDVGLYLLRGNSTRRKISYLRKLLPKYNLPLETIDLFVQRQK